jgi:DNA polymerase I
MHNGIHFDAHHISRLLHYIDPQRVIDTLILSRLVDYSRDGGHSLDAWGERLGYRKIKFTDFGQFSPQMLTYCKRDVEITYQLWISYLSSYWHDPAWKPAIDLELKCAVLGEEMSANGFPFDIETAKELKSLFEKKLSVLDKEIKDVFPAKSVLVREITPVATKHGTIHKKDFRWAVSPSGELDLTSFSVDCPFSLIKFEEFNPGSTKQIVSRMNEAGWKPVEKTKKHIEVERELRQCRSRIKRKELEEKLRELKVVGWKISEKNLETLPDDAPQAAKKLTERLVIARRLSTLEEWISAYREDSQCVHGVFNTIGCWTHRFSHVGPNFANIVSVDKPFGREMRGLWRAEEDSYLIDVDAEGIQLRVLAHYMDDEAFTDALVNGDKDLGTDAHSLNKRALGDVCQTRDQAKTFIYSWLLGAGVSMTSSILRCSLSAAKQARENFENFYPGLKHLRKVLIPMDASRGFFVGLDGRKVPCDSEHHMLSGYLQNGEVIIMKTAWLLADATLKALRLPFKWINLVHDEFVVLTPRDLELANEVKTVLSNSIVEAGELLNLKCPMAGSGDIGTSWAEIH